MTEKTCVECGKQYPATQMSYIPEIDGGYWLCRACEEVVEDAWDRLQAEIHKNVQ